MGYRHCPGRISTDDPPLPKPDGNSLTVQPAPSAARRYAATDATPSKWWWWPVLSWRDVQVLGMARFMNWSKSGTVKAVSPWAGL